MQYDFDRVIDRRTIDSAKWTAYPKDVLPLWVADSDFQCPQPVIDAVMKIAETGVYGYPNGHAGIVEKATVSWCARHYGLEVLPSEVQYCPSMCFGLAVAIRAFTKPGGKVLMQVPAYPPFIELAKSNGRIPSMNALKLVDGRYEIDFEDFERRAADPECTLFLLCSPHNPTGRVFSKEELERIVSICCRHNVVILADEVHSGFVFKGEHTTLLTLSEAARSITVYGNSPSKTFNTAGLRAAVLISKNPALAARVKAELAASQPDRLFEWGLVVFITCAASFAVLASADWLERHMGEKLTLAFERLTGLLLAMMATQMFLGGFSSYLESLPKHGL